MEFVRSYLDITVFGILMIMSFLVVWFFIERIIFYHKIDVSKYPHFQLLHVDLTNNLTIISSIGANAPYIGLLGTVIGILITFYDLGMNDKMETGQIMVGLALALKATAGGIALAIPSIIVYNYMMRKVDVLEAKFHAHQDLNG
jgi:biopolymer transport protein ExbB